MLSKIAKFFIRTYQYLLSPFLGTNCRFSPSCSHYALEAVEVHGAVNGTYLSIKRVVRCHPFCEAGYDPVPPKTQTCNKKSMKP